MKSEVLKNNKGITLIALIVTIIILLVLSTIAIYTGFDTIRSSKFMAFKTEMQLLQASIDEYYSSNKDVFNSKGINLTDEQKNIFTVSEVSNILSSKKENIANLQNGFKYYTEDILVNDLQIEGITRDYFINIDKRIIISSEPFEYDGINHYMLEQFEDGGYNIEYSVTEGEVTFDVSYEIISTGSYKIKVNNITTEGYNNKWQIKYKLEGDEYYNTSEEFVGTEKSFLVQKQGKYEVKVIHGNEIESMPAYVDITKVKGWNEDKKVNVPVLADGMTEIMFKEPTDTEKGDIIDKNSEDFDLESWYDYNEKRWANAITQDGSIWVWIPRFAYQIDKENQTVNIVFLIDDTDNYYDENGNLQVAKRCTNEEAYIDTTVGYTVHPAFTNEENINYRNGRLGFRNNRFLDC